MLRIWIDTDNALGSTSGDVDDGYALSAILAAAALSPDKVHIEGISVVSGNTDHATAFKCTLRLLQYFSSLDLLLTSQSLAPSHIADIRNCENPVQILALGPLTNITQALEVNPSLADHTQVHWVGGVRHGYHFRRRLSDLNVARDKKSAAVIKRLVTQTQYPLDVIDRLVANAGRLEDIGRMSPVGQFISANSKRWLRRACFTHLRRSFPVWDLVPALNLLGQLPQAQFTANKSAPEASVLTSFDADAAWHLYANLIAQYAAWTNESVSPMDRSRQ
jgi:inosine-uridine nucleoside N-ribohydrolase